MQITKHTLPNGMDILLNENHSSPVISFNVLVHAGSAIETNDEAGLCHVIEHMIFKGTPSRPVGAIARDIEASGGEVNAYTSFDQTVFYINMASRFSGKGLEILSDAVQNPLFDANELSRELEVICEEIRRGKDSPSHCISEDLFSHAFSTHTYGRPIIGFTEIVKSFTREKVQSFYRKHYTPDNMTLIVVGDFKSDEMSVNIARAFSNFKTDKALPRQDDQTIELEPPQSGLKVHTNTMEIQSTHFMLGFHVPEITHDDIPALDILSHILGGADSSRFEQIIKEKKRLVHNIYCYAFTPKFPGLFAVGGMMQPEKTLHVIDAIWEEVQKIIAEPVSADELNRAKINIRASELYERETVGGLAAKLAYFLATAGNHEFEKRYFQILNDVTVDDVRMIAQKYLTPQNCTVEILSPKKAKTQPTIPAIEAACTGKKNMPAIKKQERRPPQIHQLPNGIKLIIQENHTLPIVAVYAAMPGGLSYETPQNNGISYLTARTLTKGTSRRSAIDIAKKIESIAGMIDGFCGRNSLGLRSEFLSEKLHDGFGLFAEVLTQAAFDNEEVEKERAQQIETIQNQEDSLHAMAFVYFMKKLYGGHPYGMRILGEVASVKKLTPAMLKKYWAMYLNPAGMIISVVGDVSPSEIKRLANDWIKIKRGKIIKAPKIPITAPKTIVTNEIVKKGKEQTHIVMGFMGTTIKSPDHYKLSVLNQILSGQGGRLFLNLRDKMSLAYAVSSTMQSSIHSGHFAVYIGTEPSKADTALAGIKKELGQLLKELVSKEELERAQQYIVGTYELDQQKNSALASNYVFNELYGLGIAELEHYPQKILKITREDILKVAQKYIKLDAYVLSVVKPA